MLTLRQWLSHTPYTLALSSSFFGFYSHCGIAAALFEAGLQPAKLTGSSAGALVAGALASGLSPEETGKVLFSLRRSDFWDPRPGPGYLRGRKMLEVLQQHFVPSFADAKIPLEVCVFDLLSCKTRFLRDGPLPASVAASCAVPLLFHPVRIGLKFFIDGGVFHKSGIAGGKKDERILCVYLQSEGLSSAYEWKASLRKLEKNHRVLSFRGLPSVHYNSLEKGKDVYATAYKRTKDALDQPFHAGIVHS